MKRMSISLNIEWGKSDESDDEDQPKGDVYATTERRVEDQERQPVGFRSLEGK